MANPRLDRIDINILAQLQADGALSNVELAGRVGLSPSPCLQRVRRLRKAGYIEGYTARLDLGKVLEHMVVFTEVTLSDHRREDFVRFEREMARVAHLQELHLVSGGYDYLLKFTVRSVLHYQEVITQILDRNLGVEKYFSYIVIRTLMDRGQVSLTALLED